MSDPELDFSKPLPVQCDGTDRLSICFQIRETCWDIMVWNMGSLEHELSKPPDGVDRLYEWLHISGQYMWVACT